MAAQPYTMLPPPIAAVYHSIGVCIGANGGYATSRNCWKSFAGAPFTAVEGCHNADGGVVGGAGCRRQAGTCVFGLEAQGDWADFKVQASRRQLS
jgi:outer membrane immunogenic protein